MYVCMYVYVVAGTVVVPMYIYVYIIQLSMYPTNTTTL